MKIAFCLGPKNLKNAAALKRVNRVFTHILCKKVIIIGSICQLCSAVSSRYGFQNWDGVARSDKGLDVFCCPVGYFNIFSVPR